MNSEAADRLPERFARHFLERGGAVVEPLEAGWEAVLPEELAGALNLPELVTARTPKDGAVPVLDSPESDAAPPLLGYGSPLIERMVERATAGTPVAVCRLAFDYLKSGGFEKLLEESFSVPDAVLRLENHAEIQTEYLVMTVWYQAQSDEQQEGLVTLSFHRETGVLVPGMDDELVGLRREFLGAGKAGPDLGPWKKRLPIMGRAMERAVSERIAVFREQMERRYRRDIRNMAEYYAGYRAEMEKSLERTGLSEQLVAERREKMEMIPDELARKSADLRNKYGVKVTVRPAAFLRVLTPAVKLPTRATVGRERRNLSFFYNPKTQALDPWACESCGAATWRIRFTEKLKAVCPACRGK
ncbi:MAG: hypothetical protein ACLFN9_23540 [Desulfococcaceae bacterium]